MCIIDTKGIEGNRVNLTVDIDVQVDGQGDINPFEDYLDLITTQEWHHWFETWLAVLQPDLSPIHAYALGLRLTGDVQMQHLNATFRHIDKSTDVLAFAALEWKAMPAEIWNFQPLELGDIVISLETAEKQAREQNHSVKQEIAWLASHGFLHLLGWDHPTADLLNRMLTEQKKLLTQAGILGEVKKCI